MPDNTSETAILNPKTAKASNQNNGSKNEKKTYTVTKFVLSISDTDKESINLIASKLDELNDKAYGREIKFSDMALHAIRKLDSQDVKDIKLKSIKKGDVAELALQRYNTTNNENLSQEDIVLKFLKSDTKEVYNELSK